MPNQEIQTVQKNQVQSVTESQTSAVLSMIERVATNPDADIEKLEKMLDMQERILDRNAEQAFNAAMAKMQGDLPRVARTAKGQSSRYAPLEDINNRVMPVLQANGFAVTFSVKQLEKEIRVVTKLIHRDGHSESTEISLPHDTSGNKNNVQAVGSSISYGKRYGICAILNISTGDDTDGQHANSPVNKALGVDYITLAEVKEIHALFTKAGLTEQQFLQKLRINAVEELESSRLEGTRKWLDKISTAQAGGDQ